MNTAPIRIEAIRPGRDSDWVVVVLSSGEAVPLPDRDLLGMDLAPGDELDEAGVEELQHRSEAARARTSAINQLASRARSEGEIRMRLRKKGYSDRAIEDTIAWLHQRSYLDDAAYARAFIRDRLRLRPRGRRGLVSELRTRHIDGVMAEEMIEDVLANDSSLPSFGEAARALAQKWLRCKGHRYSDPWKQRQALWNTLARKGFDSDVIREAVESEIST